MDKNDIRALFASSATSIDHGQLVIRGKWGTIQEDISDGSDIKSLIASVNSELKTLSTIRRKKILAALHENHLALNEDQDSDELMFRVLPKDIKLVAELIGVRKKKVMSEAQKAATVERLNSGRAQS